MRKMSENTIKSILIVSLALALFSVGALYISHAAEGFIQETGTGTSMLGYNRDSLVAAKPYIIVALLISSVVVTIFALLGLFRGLKR